MCVTPRLLLPLLALVPLALGQTPKAEPDAQRIPPKTAAESLKAFEVAPGFHVELVAAEPLVQSPIACDWDLEGRLWVVELPEYNAYASTRPHGKGRVVILEDTDGDGVMDKRTVFADNLNYPTGIFCTGGGAYVGAAPDLLFLSDSTGKGSATDRRVALTGFGTDKAGEGQLNSFRWSIDNRILFSTGLDGGEVRGDGGNPKSARGMNIKISPRGGWETTSGGGQYGMSVDDFGRVYVCSNSEPIQTLAYDARYLKGVEHVQAPPAAVNILPTGKFTRLHRISAVEPWRDLRTRLRKEGKVPGSDEGGKPSGFFTSATGITVYRGDAFPADYRGNVFVGEPANNLIFRAKLKENGSLPVAEPADPEREFLASKDVWFRPVQLANAPDGCLYVIDMYRELIEGAAFLPPEALKTVDPSAGLDKGRIWRIVPDGFKRQPLPKLRNAGVNELVKLLEHPNGWHRDTASRLIWEDSELVYPKYVKGADEQARKILRESPSPPARIHALHALDGMYGGLDDKTLLGALRNSDAQVRAHALRYCEQTHIRKGTYPAYDIWELRRDPDISVRIQLAYSMKHIVVTGGTPRAGLSRRPGCSSSSP
jgi:putative membrane-bound dehydrogenase-like protein